MCKKNLVGVEAATRLDGVMDKEEISEENLDVVQRKFSEELGNYFNSRTDREIFCDFVSSDSEANLREVHRD